MNLAENYFVIKLTNEISAVLCVVFPSLQILLRLIQLEI